MTFLGTSYCFVGLNIELGKKKKAFQTVQAKLSASGSNIERLRINTKKRI